jgi:hypothetical protein
MESKSGFTPSIAVVHHHVHQTHQHDATQINQQQSESTPGVYEMSPPPDPGLTIRIPSMFNVIPVLDVLDQDPDETFGPFGGGVDGDEVDRFISSVSRGGEGGGGG